jgi:hypothetical protein
MGPESGGRWRASDSAGSALVLLVAGVCWAVAGLVTGLFSVVLLVTRPGGPPDVSDEL